MNCPYCGHDNSEVVRVARGKFIDRRRKRCLDCGSKFSTHEKIATAQKTKKAKKKPQVVRIAAA
jgi:transcriptional regulator NrdR family protein